MKKYCLACDLRNDESAFKAYDEYHRDIWPEIKESLQNSGVLGMEIFRTGSRLFMIMWVSDSFSFEKKATLDASNPIVQKWETLMSTYQQPVPWAGAGVKWLVMDQVFNFEAQT